MRPACPRAAGRARAERWKFLHSPSSATRDTRPPMTSSSMTAARSQYLLDLLAQVPDPRKRRGRRHRAGGAAGRRDRGGDRGVAVVRRDRAVGRRCRPGGAGRAGRGPRPGGGVHLPARVRPGQRRRARPGSRRLAAHQGGAGRRPAGDRDRRQDRPRREEQGREGPAPGRGPGARHRRGPRAGRRGREIERDPRGAGPAESVRQPRRRGYHDRRHAHAERHRAGHPRPGRRLRDDRQGQHADACTGS